MDYTVHHINDSKDLKVYEKYLANDTVCYENENNNCGYFKGYLKKCIGKLIRVESLIGNRLQTRTGILMDVGCDYIVIKTATNCSSMVIEGTSIKYITVLHSISGLKRN